MIAGACERTDSAVQSGNMPVVEIQETLADRDRAHVQLYKLRTNRMFSNKMHSQIHLAILTHTLIRIQRELHLHSAKIAPP